MTPYRFDRGTDWQFLRSTDFQFNSEGMEGQVIAQHLFLGCPPFTASECHGTPDAPITDSDLSNPWITSIDTWLGGGQPFSGTSPVPDFCDLTVRDTYTPLRFCTWTFEGSGGYYHSLTSGRHTPATPPVPSIFPNSGNIIHEVFTSLSKTTGELTTYEFKLDEDTGELLNANTGIYAGGDFQGPNYVASLAAFGGTSWPPEHYHDAGTDRICWVTPSQAYLSVTYKAAPDPDGPFAGGPDISTNIWYRLTLTNGWALDGPSSITAEIDLLLAHVTLNCRGLYLFYGETEPRPLLAGGESITVTHEGPFLPDESGLHPARIVLRSNGAWNWSNNGPCIVAQYLNDIVTAVGETGIDGDMDEGSVLSNYFGGVWTAMKSRVFLPNGYHAKTVLSFKPPIHDAAAFAYPYNTMDFDCGGELQSIAADDVFGRFLEFTRGNWMTITKLDVGSRAGAADRDGTQADIDGRRADV